MEPKGQPPTPPPEPEGFERFRQFVRNLIGVPKSELDTLLAEEKKRKAAAQEPPPSL